VSFYPSVVNVPCNVRLALATARVRVCVHGHTHAVAPLLWNLVFVAFAASSLVAIYIYRKIGFGPARKESFTYTRTHRDACVALFTILASLEIMARLRLRRFVTLRSDETANGGSDIGGSCCRGPVAVVANLLALVRPVPYVRSHGEWLPYMYLTKWLDD
jgi:hypothetical protein